MSVSAQLTSMSIPTYGLGEPERNPMFFRHRVYQGSSGAVYPLPFVDRVLQDEPPQPVEYQAAVLENPFVRLVMLPEIGGRIFTGQDKTNNNFDFFYRQDVIKPALVGLAGPWISGGVEFNWPQHHRPGTYMPADVTIEQEPDGARTVWMSEHDPIGRLKGMHGIRLRPDSNLIELRGRLYNRTPFKQTFLWWANTAVRVHDEYQSFFPPDVHYVADHAVRAMTGFPVADSHYYGVDYPAHPGTNDLRWYRNIPVPTSYMICETSCSFLGGYDHSARGGFLHVADPAVSPGKKQWTWGNAAFGQAWDRELTDENGPYIELMAGVFTDNQPDFSYLLPYETKTFSQYWWPYQGIGVVSEANTEAAISLTIQDGGQIDVGVAVSRPFPGATVVLTTGDSVSFSRTVDLAPDSPFVEADACRHTGAPESVCLSVYAGDERMLVSYRPRSVDPRKRSRSLASEPAPAAQMSSADELYLTGEHLELYRHPTRAPETYWNEALRRDPGDSRSNLALGRLALRRGDLATAERHLQAAVDRLTNRHPTPETGEAHFFLGVVYRVLGKVDTARRAFERAAWDRSFKAPAEYELALLAIGADRPLPALNHLRSSLQADPANNKARTLGAVVLRLLGQKEEALREVELLLADDPLDHWAAYERSVCEGTPAVPPHSRNDAQTILDLAFEYADAGLFGEAVTLLDAHHATPVETAPVPNPLRETAMTRYALAWALRQSGDDSRSREVLDSIPETAHAYLFPSRLQEQTVLEWVAAVRPDDATPRYGLGNFCYHYRRSEDAIRYWESGTEKGNAPAQLFRNLGIAYWNTRRDQTTSLQMYRRAMELDPRDARLVTEYVQLLAKAGNPATERLEVLEKHVGLIQPRDDAMVELAALYNQTGKPERALEILTGRSFHPWEGGEGKVLRQYADARIGLGRKALSAGRPQEALEHFEKAVDTPDSLGEKFHPHQAKADVLYWQGQALQALGDKSAAGERFLAAASETGDFQEMAVVEYSELTLYRARALAALDRRTEAVPLITAMREYAEAELHVPAKTDYFATSLPVFDEDLDEVKQQRMRRYISLCDEFLAEHSTERPER